MAISIISILATAAIPNFLPAIYKLSALPQKTEAHIQSIAVHSYLLSPSHIKANRTDPSPNGLQQLFRLWRTEKNTGIIAGMVANTFLHNR